MIPLTENSIGYAVVGGVLTLEGFQWGIDFNTDAFDDEERGFLMGLMQRRLREAVNDLRCAACDVTEFDAGWMNALHDGQEDDIEW